MLLLTEVWDMTVPQLELALQDVRERISANEQSSRGALGAVSTFHRGGTKIRTRLTRKPDRKRLEELRRTSRSLYSDLRLLNDEMKRRAHAEDARD